MPYFKNIETAVLLTMLAAHSVNYRRLLTKKEATGCKKTIIRLQSEIELRQKGRIDIIAPGPLLTLLR